MAKDNYPTLKKKVALGKTRIGVIGLGYVGLPLAVCFSMKGFDVVGIDIDAKRIEKIKKGECYILDVDPKEMKSVVKNNKFKATTDFKMIKQLDAVIICVPTPLGSDRKPDTSYIREAVTRIRENIRKNQIIVLESTTYPGTTREILLPILESKGLKEGRDFYLAFSPERVDPGNEEYKTHNTPKIIGGMSKRSTSIAKALYEKVINNVVPVSSASAAEMVKLLENTFRIVNIAMVNELATLCDKLNLDMWEIIEAAKTKPYGFMPFYPGPGVGGHCIPVDPLYLSWKAREHGFETRFIDLASKINEAMPHYVIERIERMLRKKKKTLNGSNILILGVAYKKDVKDLRESPSIEIIDVLKKRGVNVSFFDPLFPYLKINGINLKRIKKDAGIFKQYDAAILISDHTDFDYEFLKNNLKLIFDTRNAFRKRNIRSRKIISL